MDPTRRADTRATEELADAADNGDAGALAVLLGNIEGIWG
jgi:hypothetical protein